MSEIDRAEILRTVIGAHTRERLVEYPFAFQHLEGHRILDVGSVDSLLPVGLAKLGYDVYGLDLRKYSKQPWFSFVLGDAMRLPFRDGCFDQVLSISTTEHVGLRSHGLEHLYPVYGLSKTETWYGDRLNVLEMARVTRPGGSIILTLPYGQGQHYWLRIYNPGSLATLIEGFNPEIIEYYKEVAAATWIPASEAACRVMVGHPLPRAVVCMRLRV